jgi:hypothetical protein
MQHFKGYMEDYNTATKDTKHSSSSRKSHSVNQNEYGKYGIIKEENFFHKQRY